MFPTAPPNPPLTTSRGTLIGTDARLLEVIDTLRRVSRSNCTVLVTGESGTGKELAVAALHDASDRREGPLVAVNCGAIPENLVESEVFGHAQGAFTGANAAHRGRVHAAEGGTLFLDEIGELPLAVQVKILRLLQAREYSPLGDPRIVKCDVRVVTATKKNLEAEVAAGRFREDLYYRLNVVHVHLPPLRERGDDVCSIADHFLRLVSARANRQDILGFSDDAYALLKSSDWPGNVRALENAVERAVLLGKGPSITVDDFTPYVRAGAVLPALTGALVLPDDGLNLKRAVDEFESELIRQALARTGGNKNRAAQLLGMNRTTLVEMVKRKRIA